MQHAPITPRPAGWTALDHPATRAQVEDLLRCGQSCAAIARQLGLRAEPIRALRRKLRLPPRRLLTRDAAPARDRVRDEPQATAPAWRPAPWPPPAPGPWVRGRRQAERDVPIKTEIARRLLAGESNAEIARAVNRYPGFIKQVREQMGLPPADRKLDPATRAKIEELLRTGLSCAEVARQLGRSRSAILRLYQELGLPPRRHPARDRAEQLLRSGESLVEVRRITGISANTAVMWSRQLRGRNASPTQARDAPLRARADGMLLSGGTDRAVAQALGVSRLRVSLWRRDLGLPPARRGRRPQD